MQSCPAHAGIGMLEVGGWVEVSMLEKNRNSCKHKLSAQHIEGDIEQVIRLFSHCGVHLRACNYRNWYVEC